MSDQVVITAVVPAVGSVTFDLNGISAVTGGAGGWEELARPRRRAATQWVGLPGRLQTLPLLLDGVGPGGWRSVEAEIRTVTAWGRPTDATDEPPILVISGPVGDTSGRWVVDDISWDAELRDTSGVRVQQDLTLVLRQYVPATITASPAKKARAKKKSKDKADKGKRDKPKPKDRRT